MSRFFVLSMITMMISIASLEDASRRYERNEKSLAINTREAVLSRYPRTLFKNPPSLFFLHLLKHKPRYQKLEKISTTTAAPNTTRSPRNCICVPFYLCDASQNVITDGSGIIDFRTRQCTGDFEVCCYLRNATTPRPTPPPIIPPTLFPNCVCVNRSLCDPNGIITFSGQGIINPRQNVLCPGTNQVCCRLLMIPTQLPTIRPTVTVPPVVTVPPQQQLCFICGNLTHCISCGTIVAPDGGNIIDPRVSQILSQGNICSAIPTGLLPCQSAIVVPITDLLGPLRNSNTSQACYCVKTWLCSEGNVISPDGLGVIDPRFTACSSADQVCCRLAGIDLQGLRNSGISVLRDATTNNERPSRSAQITCGIRNNSYAPAQPFPAESDKTYFAEFPWMVALLTKADSESYTFQCGASMISNSAVLTAAHCVINQKPENLMARFGQWNIESNVQPLPTQEAKVLAIITHPSYYSGGLFHDVAVLILGKPVTYNANILPICLPEQGMIFAANIRCYGIGWGSNSFGSERKYQAELRKIDLPIIDRESCQTRLRGTKLGQYFQLHGSFICAGGETDRDMCRGDGGGPLVCQTSTGQFYQAGIVSWGIGCGTFNVPAVYTSVSQHRQWIDQQLATYGA